MKPASPIEVLNGKVLYLRSIELIGFSCSLYCDPRMNSMQNRMQRGIIVGFSNKTKGSKMLTSIESEVIVMQHVKDINTLFSMHNPQLQLGQDTKQRVGKD
uniref:LAGLIDADG endonuclease n=1 Tax=Peronospora matthiolae TaxID=2874970 RepID=A0AAV1VND6_9STRA